MWRSIGGRQVILWDSIRWRQVLRGRNVLRDSARWRKYIRWRRQYVLSGIIIEIERRGWR